MSFLRPFFSVCLILLVSISWIYGSPRKYILTGGPSVGKTTLLHALKKRGFVVIEESATTIIKGDLQKGLPNPACRGDGAQFQERVWRHQLELAACVADAPCVFFDRSLIDGLVYNEFYNTRVHPDLIPTIQKTHYDLVFYLDLLDVIVNDDVRLEDKKTAHKMHELIKKHYESFDYSLIGVPAFLFDEKGKRLSIEDSVVKRADFVCQIVNAYESAQKKQEKRAKQG